MSAGNAAVATAESRVEIASYRDVFDLERRIYRIDRLRLNPGGVPLRGVVYALLGAVAVVALDNVPLLGVLLRLMPWYVRYLAVPGLLGALGCTARIAGRPFHLAGRGLVLQCLRPRQLSGFARCARIGSRWHPPPVIVVDDGSGARPRRLVYSGPGVVAVRREHRVSRHRTGVLAQALKRPDLELEVSATERPLTGEGRAIALGRGTRLVVAPLRPADHRRRRR